MIRAIYRSGEEDWVSPKFLDILLYLGQIQMFKRDSDWVVVGVDQLRSSVSVGPVSKDRRIHAQTPLPVPIETNIWPTLRLQQ